MSSDGTRGNRGKLEKRRVPHELEEKLFHCDKTVFEVIGVR